MASAHKQTNAVRNDTKQIDLREQLYNGRETGSLEQIQLPTEAITALHGINCDIDLNLLRNDSPVPLELTSPKKFSARTLVPILARHHVLNRAEVRDSGRNLHVNLWFAESVLFRTDGERERWAGIVKVIQASLPIDPDQPGITGLTRPVNSINSKSGRQVKILRPGELISVDDVLKFYDEMVRRPFRTLMRILLGSERFSPCPICQGQNSMLTALDHTGSCYGSCGRVGIAQLYDLFLSPRSAAKRKDHHGKP